MTAYAMRTKSLGAAFLLILSGVASLPITQAFGDVAGWLPLLSQTQTAIEAVEVAMRESLTP